jgi:Ca-activated chloride channel homolog
MRTQGLALILLAIGCSSGNVGDSAAPGAAGGGTGGGGVSFGGAQDIGELRGILDRGGVPGPSTLDANGFFNEHYHRPIPATCGQLLCATPGMSVGRDWLTGAHQATLQVAISSTVDPATYRRLAMNLVVVVDHSGSMASDGRLTKVKVGLHAMIDQLRDEDRLALIEFDDRVDIHATLATALDRPALHAIIDRLTPRGGTNIFDGLQQGFRMLGDALPSDRQNRVIFLSDGIATVGDTVQSHILQMARDHVQRGVGLTTIGVGNDFDVGLMRGLAEQSAGNFYFLEDPTAATEVFTEELDYFLQPIALAVQLETTVGPGYQFGDIAGSNLWSASATRGSMQVPAVFVASRTSQGGDQGRRGGGSMVFVQMTPIAGNTGRVATLALSYRTPGSAERVTQQIALDYTADPNTTPEQPYLSTPEIAERFAMYNTFLGLRAATKATDPSCASAVLRATRAGAAAWNASHEDPDLAADLMLIDQYLANLAAHHRIDERAIGSCATAGRPGEGPTERPREPGDHHGLYCSSGSPAGSLPIVVGALAVVGMRRRRR